MADAKPSLSKTQQELLDYLRAGGVCIHAPYAGRFNPSAYWYRRDSFKRCTAAAEALIKKGLAEEFDKNWRGNKLRAKALGEQA